MTEKDKDDNKPQAQVYNLNRNSKTVKEPETSVTQHGDEVTTSTQQKLSPFLNPNGTPNQAAEEYFRTHIEQPLQKEYGINPETGQVDDPTIYSVLGIRPEENRARREQEAKQNRRKQIASELYHSGALISDMLSAAYGGNVWKRDKDTTAKEAAARNVRPRQPTVRTRRRKQPARRSQQPLPQSRSKPTMSDRRKRKRKRRGRNIRYPYLNT